MEASSAQPIEPTGPPLLPGPLVDLFLRPSRFFSSHLALGATPYVIFVTFMCGIAYVIGRLDNKLVKADFGKRLDGLTAGVLDSWPLLWGHLLFWGLVAAMFLWELGGWWYTLRVKWSGARDADSFKTRLVYIYSSFVSALPTVVAVVVANILYANYRAYWHAEEVWSSATMIFLFWSCVTSYKGVRAMFPVSPWKARLWFLVLPIVAYSAPLALILYFLGENG